MTETCDGVTVALNAVLYGARDIMWKQISQADDPDWIEWHKEIMSPKFSRVRLKVWKNPLGYFTASMTKINGYRSIQSLRALEVEAAKLEAEEWATYDPHERAAEGGPLDAVVRPQHYEGTK